MSKLEKAYLVGLAEKARETKSKVNCIAHEISRIYKTAGTGEKMYIAMLIHDYLVYNIKHSDINEIQNAEEVLARGTATSLGFANTFYAIGRKLGINASVNKKRDNRGSYLSARNKVKFNGGWYIVDCYADRKIYDLGARDAFDFGSSYENFLIKESDCGNNNCITQYNRFIRFTGGGGCS